MNSIRHIIMAIPMLLGFFQGFEAITIGIYIYIYKPHYIYLHNGSTPSCQGFLGLYAPEWGVLSRAPSLSLSLNVSMYSCTCTVLARLIKFILFTTHQMYLTKNKLSIRKFTNFLIEIEHYPHQFPLVVLVQEPPKNGCHAPRTSIVVMHHNLIINQK